MYTKSLISFAAAAGIMAFSGAASAQDTSADATYGNQNLSVGFMPDPVVIPLAAGGPIDTSVEGTGSCAGFHASAPDVELTYEAGSVPLYIHVESDTDTTLLINQPDGSWICADDTIGFNPLVAFPTPASGVYDIYVGTFDAAATPPATLNITEISPM
ncbi:MAG: hypothetical protein ACI81R_000017 [Bradymonadia bacterium]|jgi:hypothetical protein